LVKEKYEDFGPTLAAEMLAEHHGFKVSRETLHKWMQDAGLWLSRKHRRTFHQPRSRRECFGELNIEILCANSSQAKGRVERANRTLQDRLVKELRLADISSIENGNVFLPGFIERYNAKFAKAPARSDNLHRALNIAPNRLNEVYCLRDKRHVTKDLMLKYDRKRIKLAVNDLTRDLAGTYVDVYELPEGRIQVRAKGVALPYTVMNPERRISHTAITENKHLSAVLAHIKEEQDKAASKPKVKPVSAKNGYVKNGRSPGRPSKLELHYAAKRAAAAQTGSES
jgi:hypothetical protein